MSSFIRLFIIFISLFALSACEKPNPEPEKLDPVYDDMLKQAAAVGSDIANFKSQLEENKAILKKVEPQTGQIKYAQKHVYQMSDIIEKLEQKKRYWEIRAENRKKRDQTEYLKAYKEKKPWPPPEELIEYRASLKKENPNLHWSYEKRMSELGLKIQKKEKPAEGAEEKPKEGGEAKAGEAEKKE